MYSSLKQEKQSFLQGNSTNKSSDIDRFGKTYLWSRENTKIIPETMKNVNNNNNNSANKRLDVRRRDLTKLTDNSLHFSAKKFFQRENTPYKQGYSQKSPYVRDEFTPKSHNIRYRDSTSAKLDNSLLSSTSIHNIGEDNIKNQKRLSLGNSKNLDTLLDKISNIPQAMMIGMSQTMPGIPQGTIGLSQTMTTGMSQAVTGTIIPQLMSGMSQTAMGILQGMSGRPQTAAAQSTNYRTPLKQKSNHRDYDFNMSFYVQSSDDKRPLKDSLLTSYMKEGRQKIEQQQHLQQKDKDKDMDKTIVYQGLKKINKDYYLIKVTTTNENMIISCNNLECATDYKLVYTLAEGKNLLNAHSQDYDDLVSRLSISQRKLCYIPRRMNPIVAELQPIETPSELNLANSLGLGINGSSRNKVKPKTSPPRINRIKDKLPDITRIPTSNSPHSALIEVSASKKNKTDSLKSRPSSKRSPMNQQDRKLDDKYQYQHQHQQVEQKGIEGEITIGIIDGGNSGSGSRGNRGGSSSGGTFMLGHNEKVNEGNKIEDNKPEIEEENDNEGSDMDCKPWNIENNIFENTFSVDSSAANELELLLEDKIMANFHIPYQ